MYSIVNSPNVYTPWLTHKINLPHNKIIIFIGSPPPYTWMKIYRLIKSFPIVNRATKVSTNERKTSSDQLNLYKYGFKFCARMVLYVIPEIGISIKFEGIQCLPLCNSNWIYPVNFELIPTPYAIRPLRFPDGYVLQRLIF